MLLVPNRLLEAPFVNMLFHGLHFSLLKKSLTKSLFERESYVVRHAVSIVLKGKQVIRGENGLSLDIEAGQIGFIPKGIYTVSDLLPEGGEFESWHIFIDTGFFEKLRGLAGSSAVKKEGEPVVAIPDLLYAYFETLEEASKNLNGVGELYYEGKIREFFGILLASYGPEWLSSLFHLYGKKPVVNLGSFMEAHFDKPFSVDDFAYLTGLSNSSFNREFKRKFGSTPRKWLIEKRLHRAAELLNNPQLSVAEVAEMVGFNHTSHFIKSFKKAFGHTPGEHHTNGLLSE